MDIFPQTIQQFFKENRPHLKFFIEYFAFLKLLSCHISRYSQLFLIDIDFLPFYDSYKFFTATFQFKQIKKKKNYIFFLKYMEKVKLNFPDSFDCSHYFSRFSSACITFKAEGTCLLRKFKWSVLYCTSTISILD